MQNSSTFVVLAYRKNQDALRQYRINVTDDFADAYELRAFVCKEFPQLKTYDVVDICKLVDFLETETIDETFKALKK